MELEPSSTEFNPPPDARPRLEPPVPAQLVAIADVNLNAAVGLERQLDAFYVGLLRMERDAEESRDGAVIVYRADNFRLRISLCEVPPEREDYRPLGVVVPSLADLAWRLTEAKVEFVRRSGLFAGSECLVLIDPAGNYVEVMEMRLLV